ncbi:LuxR family transcriptional regulator [Glaciihabitans sp. dw_435]|uniref:helix-turn-helix transcriptional regulator n=1 Tax=Glaciihabitans sp. dw_435 TaxID=2720081 RepID=UPI001BD5CD4F|nr:LuxR family transcriptional regulator [Glaciihabitans sp. dw_435]
MTPRQELPLVGRHELLAEVLDELGLRPRVFGGAAGVGKTRLLHAVRDAATSAGLHCEFLVATEALATVPLGVFVSLLPGDIPRTPADPSDMLVFAASVIRAEILRRGIRMLAIDDVHVLDPASAGLLHQIALSGVAVYATVRTDRPVHDAITALWKGGLSQLIEVPVLTAGESGELVATELGGAVDRRVSTDVFARTGGNALFLLEVVRVGVATGAIVQRSGVWVLARSLPVAQGVRAAVTARVRTLPSVVRATAELVALAEPLDAELLAGIIHPEAVDEAENEGVVSVDRAAGSVRLAHPLQAEALLGSLTESRRRRRSRELVDAITARRRERDSPSDAERVLLARLHLQLDDPIDATELVDLAEIVHTSDPALCDRFLVAALRQAGTVAVRLRIATLLAHQQRITEAERVLDSLDPASLGGDERISVLITRAFLFAMPANQPARALETVDDAIATFGRIPILLAVRSTALWRLGRVTAAVTASVPLAMDESLPAETAAHAALTATSALMYAGDAEGFEAMRARLSPLALRTRHELPEAEESAILNDHYAALFLREDLDEARTRGERGYTQALHRGDDGVRSQHALLLGWNAVLRGHLPAGLGYLGEALAARGIWCSTTLAWTRSLYAQTLALAGDVPGARSMLATIHGSIVAPIYDPDVCLADAAVLASSGDLQEAARVATAAANHAHTLGQHVAANALWYAATRYGDVSAASRLLAFSMPSSAVLTAKRAHASALVRSDPVGIEAAAEQLADHDFTWFAAEAQSQAVALYRASGATYRSTAAAVRLSAMLESTEGLHSPVVAALPHVATLTPREFEIARFASSGLTDRAISESLGITLRTVQTHLSRVYNKLGARSRSELRAWLPGQDR